MERQPPPDRFEFYREHHGDWVWRRLDADGVVIDRSVTTFKERGDCVAHAVQHGYREGG